MSVMEFDDAEEPTLKYGRYRENFYDDVIAEAEKVRLSSLSSARLASAYLFLVYRPSEQMRLDHNFIHSWTRQKGGGSNAQAEC